MPEKNGAPGKIRTSDLLVRSPKANLESVTCGRSQSIQYTGLLAGSSVLSVVLSVPGQEVRRSLRLIVDTVSDMALLPPALVRSPSKRRDLCLARFAAVYAARELTAASFPMIGKEIGGRDHTTILNAYFAFMARFALPEREKLLDAVRERIAPVLQREAL